MHEKLIMKKAKVLCWYGRLLNSQAAQQSPPTNASNDVTHTLPHKKMYVISYHETTNTNGQHRGRCTAQLTGINPSTQIHPVILSWLVDNWDIEIGSD
jgi:hypothetical protein